MLQTKRKQIYTVFHSGCLSMENWLSLARDISKVNSECTVLRAGDEQHWWRFLRVPMKMPRCSQTESNFERSMKKKVRTAHNKDESLVMLGICKDDEDINFPSNWKGRMKLSPPILNKMFSCFFRKWIWPRKVKLCYLEIINECFGGCFFSP